MLNERPRKEPSNLQVARELLGLEIRLPLETLVVVFHFDDLPGKALFYETDWGKRKMKILDEAEAIERAEAVEARYEKLKKRFGYFGCESHVIPLKDREQFAEMARSVVKNGGRSETNKQYILKVIKNLLELEGQP